MLVDDLSKQLSRYLSFWSHSRYESQVLTELHWYTATNSITLLACWEEEPKALPIHLDITNRPILIHPFCWFPGYSSTSSKKEKKKKDIWQPQFSNVRVIRYLYKQYPATMFTLTLPMCVLAGFTLPLGLWIRHFCTYQSTMIFFYKCQSSFWNHLLSQIVKSQVAQQTWEASCASGEYEKHFCCTDLMEQTEWDRRCTVQTPTQLLPCSVLYLYVCLCTSLSNF